MKWMVMVFFLLQGVLFAGEMEVRSYRVGEEALRRFYWEQIEGSLAERDPFEVDADVDVVEGANWLGEEVKDLPFESRFLTGVDSVRDCTKRVEGFLGRNDFQGRAVYDVKRQLMVVQAGAGWHEMLADSLERRFPRMIRTGVEIYAVPGVVRGTREMFWSGPPEGAELLTSLSCLALPGTAYAATTGKGGFVMEGEVQIDGNDWLVDSSATWSVDVQGSNFSWKTGFQVEGGMPLVCEIGSLDGARTVLAVMRHDLVLMDGGLLNEWVLKEEGGAFLGEEKLRNVVKVDEDVSPVEDERGFRVFTVPPTFETFIATAAEAPTDDPFATGTGGERKTRAPLYGERPPELEGVKEGGLYDWRELLEKNGVAFAEGDFVVLHKKSGRLFAKLSEMNLELLEGIVMCTGPGEPRWVRVDFLKVELETGGKNWKPGDGKILKKTGICLLPGLSGEVTFGEELAFEVEVQIDGNDENLDVRATLSELGKDLAKPSFKTGAILRNGAAVKIQESQRAGKRVAWVVRATVVTRDEVVKGYLKTLK
ncbi:MAG: hypothetical protein ACJAQT_002510 [Akkermansiaceae bacterium]|jgi:hypothetical protein